MAGVQHDNGAAPPFASARSGVMGVICCRRMQQACRVAHQKILFLCRALLKAVARHARQHHLNARQPCVGVNALVDLFGQVWPVHIQNQPRPAIAKLPFANVAHPGCGQHEHLTRLRPVHCSQIQHEARRQGQHAHPVRHSLT